MTIPRNGDRCPACGGSGDRYMSGDAHRSAGIVPCHFSTSRRVPGSNTTYVDLKCVGGVLTREHSVPEPECSRLNDIDAAAKVLEKQRKLMRAYSEHYE